MCAKEKDKRYGVDVPQYQMVIRIKHLLDPKPGKCCLQDAYGRRKGFNQVPQI